MPNRISRRLPNVYNSGQAVIEFSFLTIITVLVFGSAGSLILQHWKRSKCAYLVFETTHARLTTRREPKATELIQLQEGSDTLTGVGVCGNWTERVELPKLEAAQW